jgi:two-component system OmpR family response regulator
VLRGRTVSRPGTVVREQPVGSADLGRVLVADSDSRMTDLVATVLRFVGFDVRSARTASDALGIAEEFRPHLLVLDTTLRGIGAPRFRQLIRERDEQTTVVFLTTGDHSDDRVVVAAAGDICISKPFSLDDLVSRIRQARPGNADVGRKADDDRTVLRLADLELDRDRREVRRAGTNIDLSPTEFALLRYLLENSGRIVTRPQILAHVWSYDFHGNARIVESYISFLRKKIDRFDPPLIQTLRGIGYSLRCNPDATPKGLR